MEALLMQGLVKGLYVGAESRVLGYLMLQADRRHVSHEEISLPILQASNLERRVYCSCGLRA